MMLAIPAHPTGIVCSVHPLWRKATHGSAHKGNTLGRIIKGGKNMECGLLKIGVNMFAVDIAVIMWLS